MNKSSLLILILLIAFGAPPKIGAAENCRLLVAADRDQAIAQITKNIQDGRFRVGQDSVENFGIRRLGKSERSALEKTQESYDRWVKKVLDGWKDASQELVEFRRLSEDQQIRLLERLKKEKIEVDIITVEPVLRNRNSVQTSGETLYLTHWTGAISRLSSKKVMGTFGFYRRTFSLDKKPLGGQAMGYRDPRSVETSNILMILIGR